MACFKEHTEHFPPKGHCLYLFEKGDFSIGYHFFVFFIALFKSRSIKVMEIGDIAWIKEGPLSIFTDTLHEEIRDPVGCVHIVGAPSFITSIFAQFNEVFDVEMPGF